MRLSQLESLGDALSATDPMPVLFVGHGSPMNAIEENVFVKGWRGVAARIPKPQAILCISAHWETKGTFVTAMEKPKTIHDFGGFPDTLYQVQYPAAGHPRLAQATRGIVHQTEVGLDQNWGLDHGCWSVVRRLYPSADVPVIQLSLNYSEPPEYHYQLASELRVLRERGVLLIGSGNIVHNLGKVAWDKLDSPGFGYDWALEANETIKQFISSGDHQRLQKCYSLGSAFQLAIPTAEHFLPLLYTLALQRERDGIMFFNDQLTAGSISMTSVQFGG